MSILELAQQDTVVDAVMRTKDEDPVLFVMTRPEYQSAKGMTRKTAACGINKRRKVTRLAYHTQQAITAKQR
jgi:hypothetical protein